MVDDELDEAFETHEERRQHDRSRLIVDVHFEGGEATGIASTTDISLGGFYMNTQADVLEGSRLVVRIPFASGKQIVANAEVVYRNPGKGVGVRFRELSEEDRAILSQELSGG